jgi:hypothetical protein
MTGLAHLTRTDEHQIHVIGGQVACPRVGPVDLDRCRECMYLLRFGAKDPDRPGAAYVVCTAVDVQSDLSDMAW